MDMTPGSDISAVGNEEVQEEFRSLASHLVGLALLAQPLENGRPKGEATCFFRSGFIMQFLRTWYWTTAGHVIEDIYSDIHKGRAEATDFRLVDNYGLGAKNSNPLPFDFLGAWKYFVHDKKAGLDFGVVRLGPLHRRQLESNGIVPVRKRDRRHLKGLQFHAHLIVGLPTDCVRRGSRQNPDGYTVSGSADPSMVFVKKLSRRPPQLQRTEYPRFIGKVGNQETIGDIDGTSGGPVIGFTARTNRPRVVAVQSGWLPRSRVAYACPLNVFAPLVEKQLRSRT